MVEEKIPVLHWKAVKESADITLGELDGYMSDGLDVEVDMEDGALYVESETIGAKIPIGRGSGHYRLLKSSGPYDQDADIQHQIERNGKLDDAYDRLDESDKELLELVDSVTNGSEEHHKIRTVGWLGRYGLI